MIQTRRHFTSEVCKRAIPTSTIEGCYPMLIRACHSYYYRDVHYYVIICPDHCLLIGYDASRRDKKMNMFIFRRSRIEAESKSNRNCNSRFSSQETYQNYSTQLPVHFPPRNKKCKSVEGKDQRKQHHLLLEITAAMATTKLLVITLQHNRSSLQVNRASAAKWHGNKRATNKYIIYIT